MTGGVFLYRTPECLFFASKLYVLETILEPGFEILPREVFLCFAGFLWADILCIRKKNRITSSGLDWWKGHFHLRESYWNTWSIQQIRMFSVQKFWSFQPVRDKKNLSEWIRCLYDKVIDRLCVAKSQSINDRREEMLCLDTSQLAVIPVPIVH